MVRLSKTPRAMLLVFLALSGCSEFSVFYKPTQEVSRMQRDVTDCEVLALRDAPVATQIRQSGPVFVGLGYGNGYGYWANTNTYSIDVNEDLRNRVMGYCMADRGYQLVTIPRCSDQVALQATRQSTTRFPEITTHTCVIRYESGEFQLVNQG